MLEVGEAQLLYTKAIRRPWLGNALTLGPTLPLYYGRAGGLRW